MDSHEVNNKRLQEFSSNFIIPHSNVWVLDRKRGEKNFHPLQQSGQYALILEVSTQQTLLCNRFSQNHKIIQI